MNAKVYSRKICISTNSTCNLSCVYCYEREKKYLEFDEKEALNVLLEQLKTTTTDGTKIKLHGGEPFLVFSKIKWLCEELWKHNISEYYKVHVTTNGTLIHGEIQDWLHQHRDKIQVKLSLDGNKHTSDINRPKSFDLIDIPFFVHTWPNLSVNMTITPESLPYLAENVKYLHSVGIAHIFSHFAIMIDWSERNLEKALYAQMQDLADFYLDNPQIEPCHLFHADISNTLYESDFSNSCSIGKTSAYDFQTRKYYPCYMCFPSVAGERVSHELQRIDFSDDKILEAKLCINCPFSNICVTCYAENYISRGDVSLRDMSLCKYKKVIFAVLFQYEYQRIINIDEPTPKDYQKMTAIQKWFPEIESIVAKLES